MANDYVQAHSRKRRRLDEKGCSLNALAPVEHKADTGRRSTPTRQLKLSPELQELLGGRKYCHEDELTQKLLLDFLILQNEVKVVDTFQVQVMTMTGDEISVTIDEEENKVSSVKAEIEQKEGISRHLQLLFRDPASEKGALSGGLDGDGAQRPLGREEVITESCTMYLIEKNKRKRPTQQDALDYLEQVRAVVGSNIYGRVLGILKRFRTGSIDTEKVWSKIGQLFEGHPKLMKDFLIFLPDHTYEQFSELV
jgi:hypothetical protein